MLATTALCLAMFAQAAPGPPEGLQGLIVERGTGRPLAGVAIRGSDDPNAPTVTSDDQGRFDRVAIVRMNAAPVQGPGPQCWARPEDDRDSPWEFVEAEGPPVRMGDFQRRRAVESIYQRCQSRWQKGTLVVECSPIGEIEAVVRAPDGASLVETPILILPTPNDSFPGSGHLRLPRRTDREGKFRLRTFEGVHRISVRVPGVGFGSTGAVEVAGSTVARPWIPPLARFARVEGRVDPKLLTPGAKVSLLASPFMTSTAPASPCDEQGRFSFVDLVPGVYRIAVMQADRLVQTGLREIHARPGVTLQDVVVRPPPPPSAEMQRVNQRLVRQLNADRNKALTWVEGTIRDEKGLPIPKASVYVGVQYSGGIRMADDARKATTDEQGRYKIEGPFLPMMGTLALIASAKGRPPALAYAPGPGPLGGDEYHKSAQVDVSLAPVGASANITVIQDGEKVPGAAVRVTMAGAVDARGLALGRGPARGLERDEMTALVSRTARTGLDGVARFDNLPPGLLEVSASLADEPIRPLANPSMPVAQPGAVTSRTIAIPPGGAVETSIGLERRPRPVRFQVLKPDGTAVSNRNVSLGLGQGPMRSFTSIRCDDRGFATYPFAGPGLWIVDFRFLGGETMRFPIQEEPYYQAEAVIPISSILEPEDVVVLRASRREPGSIRVRLLDEEGRPAAGTVLALGNDPQGRPFQAGTVDAEGTVRFLDVPSGKYRLQAVVDGRRPVLDLNPGDPAPDDDAPREASMVFDQESTVTTGAEVAVELRSEPVGYVRAVVKPPAGRSPADFAAVASTQNPADSARRTQADPAGGSYLFGPFRAGPVTIGLFELNEVGPPVNRWERTVGVETGRIVQVVLEPGPAQAGPPAPRPQPRPYLNMGGVGWSHSGPSELVARVLMPGGSAPACGARAYYFPVGGRAPTAQGVSDASGRLTWTGVWQDASTVTGPVSPPLAEPTVAAWLPGLTGPVIATITPGKALDLILPTSAGAFGTVTIGGRGPEGRGGRIRIVAQAKDRGTLAAAFDRVVVAEPDGRYRLPDLGAGKYIVQAARDEIWWSRSFPLVVEPGKEAGPVEIDIPEPGATVALEILDGRDRPVPGLSLSIARPEGPLKASSSRTYRADASGSAILRGLEAGRQTLLIEGDPKPHGFIVDPARPSVSRQVVRVEVPRPGP